MKLDQKAYRLIQEIRDIDEIDAIIWALAGAKRCSTFPDKDFYGPRNLEKRVVIEAISALGLEYKDGSVRIKDWPAWERFSEKYQKPNQSEELAAGLYYDIPHCCVETFCEKNGERIKQILACIDCPREVFEQQESDRFFDKILKETVALILAGKLPASLFLLMGHTYVPCSPVCENFIRQAEKMFEGLVIYLGKEQADEIVEKYKEKVTKIYK